MKQQAAYIDVNEHNKFNAKQIKSQSNQKKKTQKKKTPKKIPFHFLFNFIHVQFFHKEEKIVCDLVRC